MKLEETILEIVGLKDLSPTSRIILVLFSAVQMVVLGLLLREPEIPVGPIESPLPARTQHADTPGTGNAPVRIALFPEALPLILEFATPETAVEDTRLIAAGSFRRPLVQRKLVTIRLGGGRGWDLGDDDWDWEDGDFGAEPGAWVPEQDPRYLKRPDLHLIRRGLEDRERRLQDLLLLAGLPAASTHEIGRAELVLELMPPYYTSAKDAMRGLREGAGWLDSDVWGLERMYRGSRGRIGTMTRAFLEDERIDSEVRAAIKGAAAVFESNWDSLLETFPGEGAD